MLASQIGVTYSCAINVQKDERVLFSLKIPFLMCPQESRPTSPKFPSNHLFLEVGEGSLIHAGEESLLFKLLLVRFVHEAPLPSPNHVNENHYFYLVDSFNLTILPCLLFQYDNIDLVIAPPPKIVHIYLQTEPYIYIHRCIQFRYLE